MIGQFIQLDENRGEKTSIESQNRYAYALNNPNKYIDKNGQAAMMMNDGGSGRRKSGGIAGGGRITGKLDVLGAIGSISKIASNAAEERKKALVSGSSKATKIAKKEVPKLKRYTAETVCTTRPTPIPSTKCNEATTKVLNFISNASKHFTEKATDYINATYNQIQKLFNDPGQFFTDAWEGIKATISDPKFWTQTAVAAALAVATGGQSIWVQAIVTGSGYTMTGEGYDFAGTGFDIEKFYELKGVDNAGEYWGGALFDCVLSSGDIYVGRKAFEYIKGGKGASGAEPNKLLNNTGKFNDDLLESNYQKYVQRNIKEGKEIRNRLDWKEASDYWTKESSIARGNNFNKTAIKSDIYDYHEVYLSNGKRLDSYNPDVGEIISRKATNLDKINEDTYRKYLSEFNEKYSKGTEIRSNKYKELDGTKLNGQYILEIPASNASLSNIEHYQNIAKEYNVILRFLEEVK